MLNDIADLRSLRLRGTDGEIGSIDDAYFSDDTWTVRYLVVNTGAWLDARKVLISPRAVERLDVAGGELRLALSCERIRNSPAFDSDKPVSRQYESEYFTYFGYPYYWTGPYLWGVTPHPVPPAAAAGADTTGEEIRAREEREREAADPHLRSANEISGYALEAIDGAIGHVETFLFDDADWSVQAMVVDTTNWWPGGRVIVSPRWIESIDWSERRVRVGVARERIKESAAYERSLVPGAARDERVRQIQHALHFGD